MQPLAMWLPKTKAELPKMETLGLKAKEKKLGLESVEVYFSLFCFKRFGLEHS
jgi:hypothetical protein